MGRTYRLGASTWTFGGLPLVQVAERLSALGYDGVELLADLDRYRAPEALQVLQDHGLSVFSLTPENVDLAHPEGRPRREAIDYYLRLLDFAAALGKPLVSCRGPVGRVRALSNEAQEWALFLQAVRKVAERAQALGIRLAMGVLNRYEAHLLHAIGKALDFVAEVGYENVGILLGSYHMNIEEPLPTRALRLAADRLWLYHAADSNRQGIGRGHIDFHAQFEALADVGYDGPIILECTAPGPDPFAAIKDDHSLVWLETYLQESRDWIQKL